ncbi:MAG: TIGR04290 family methyltransferase [Bacteroidota bacterium]
MKNEDVLKKKIKEFKPWFHNLHLPGDLETAPNHFLGDFPNFKWKEIESSIPMDLRGWKVLDVGCNAGFYSFEMAKRGAEVLGIDVDEHYLKQAQWAAGEFGLDHKTEFKQMQVYDLAQTGMKFDLVIFMGVFYHLRYPLLALDILSRATKKMILFQSLSLTGEEVIDNYEDFEINERDVILQEGWPMMAFIEHKIGGDPSNWWLPNKSAIIAMMHSCGFEIIKNPAHEVYLFGKSEKKHSVLDEWDLSEYLSATGQKWKDEVGKKIVKYSE